MCKIDEVHDAEHQREAGGDQEQDQSELQAVQDLDEGGVRVIQITGFYTEINTGR